ncbi:MAG: DUF2505 family protein [Pseudomonadota bacterium]|nr:DUF2505 family protein [Pseudomonadota bacterium]
MSHTFQIQHALSGFSIDDLRTALAKPAFHEALCERLPGTNVVIERSECVDDQYHMQRALNLEANIPKLAEKFLKDALRIKRIEHWDLNTSKVKLTFVLNMPAEFRCHGELVENNQQLYFNQNWEVDVRIPLIHGALARHAESEIRRFNQIEADIFQSLLHDYR